MATTVFTPSGGALNADDHNEGTHFRVICTLSAASNGKIQVTFTASSTVGLTVTIAYVGKASGGSIGATTAAPLQLLFGGSATFSIAAGASITSDLLDHSASFSLASGDSVVVNHDEGTPGGERYRVSNTNVTTWFSQIDATLTPAYVQTPNITDGWFQSTATCYAVQKIETNTAGTNVTPTGVSGTGAVGALKGSVSRATAGVSAIGAIGSLSFSPPKIVNPTGVAAAASVGNFSFADRKGILGASAIGAAGVISPFTPPPPMGVAATGFVGSGVPLLKPSLAGALALGSANSFSFSGSSSVSLEGAAAVASTGTFVPVGTKSIAGVASAGVVGALLGAGFAAPFGASASGAAATLAPSVSPAPVGLNGTSAVGATGSFTFSGSSTTGLVGTAASGSVASFKPIALKSISGVMAGGFAGAFVDSVSALSAGVSAAGAAGLLTDSARSAPLGVSGDGATGSVSFAQQVTVNLTGISASGNAGFFSFAGLKVVEPVGVGASGQIGGFGLSMGGSISAIGVSASGQVGLPNATGTKNASVALTGVSAVGSAASIAPKSAKVLAAAAGQGQVGNILGAIRVQEFGVQCSGLTGALGFNQDASGGPIGVSALGRAGTISFGRPSPTDPDRIAFVSAEPRRAFVNIENRTARVGS